MRTLTFEPCAGTPLYRQLYDMLAQEIRTAGLTGGDRLPSRRALAAHLGLSLNTVDAAYQMLAAEGYIRAVPKSGFFVCSEGLQGLASPPAHPNLLPDSLPRPRWQYDFATGSIDSTLFPLRTWERLSREVMHDGASLLNHGDPRGDECLRRAVAAYLHEYRGVRARPAQIVIGAGSEVLLSLAVRLLEPGAPVAVEDPGYSRTSAVLYSHGIEPRPVPVDQNGMQVGALRRSGCRAACITPSHQFPTGVTMPAPRRAELLQWARETDSIIIEDDYDSEFRFDGRPIPALQGLDGDGRVIYLSTFSRILSPAIRVAYMVLPDRLAERYDKLFGSYSSTVSRFEQHTLSRFIEQGHLARHINRSRSLYRSRRDILLQSLRSLLGQRAQPMCTHTGLHMPVQIDAGADEAGLVAAAAAQGVRVRALGDYRMKSHSETPTVVLGYGGLSTDDITPACTLLARAWKACENT